MDMAMIVNEEGFEEKLAAQIQAMEENPVVAKLLDAAETIEDMYEISKNYITMKFEEFKQMFEEAMNYCKEPKMELSDETMENIVGGAPRWLKRLGKIALGVVIVAGVIAAVAVSGGVAGAAVGAVGGAIAGGLSTAAGATAAGGAFVGAISGLATGATAGGLAGAFMAGKHLIGDE